MSPQRLGNLAMGYVEKNITQLFDHFPMLQFFEKNGFMQCFNHCSKVAHKMDYNGLQRTTTDYNGLQRTTTDYNGRNEKNEYLLFHQRVEVHFPYEPQG